MTSLTLGTLTRVDISTIWPDGARDFMPWLAENSNINELGTVLDLELVEVSTEKAVGPYSADILRKDSATENDVVIENQFGSMFDKTLTQDSRMFF